MVVWIPWAVTGIVALAASFFGGQASQDETIIQNPGQVYVTNPNQSTIQTYLPYAAVAIAAYALLKK